MLSGQSVDHIFGYVELMLVGQPVHGTGNGIGTRT